MRKTTLLAWLSVVVTMLVPVARTSAQTMPSGSIAGVVKDASGAVMPGVTVEASESGPDRGHALDRHRFGWAIQNRRSQARRLGRDVHADGIQHRQT